MIVFKRNGDTARRFTGIILFILLFTPNSTAWPKEADSEGTLYSQNESADTYDPNRLIIKFKFGYSELSISDTLSKFKLKLHKKFKNFDISVFKLTSKLFSIEEIAKYMNSLKIVEYAEPDYLLRIDATYPNDPSGSQLWGLHNTGQSGGKPDADIDAPEAWDISTGSHDIVVGIIDTGVDYTHRDLSSNMWINQGEIPGNGIDDDENGYIDDVYGIDAYNNDTNPFDDHRHGTHVAGTIGASGNNGIGVVGVNWNVRMMALKSFGADGTGPVTTAIECIDYLLMMKSVRGVNVKVINASWGGSVYSEALHDAIKRAGELGVLFIAAAGNGYGNNNDEDPTYPSSYDLPNVIGVASTDRRDEMASSSSYGPTSVDLAAPGREILSTTPGNTYTILSGTSMAAPHVSGASALIWSHYPSYDSNQVKRLILNTVDPLDALYGLVLTGGRLNIHNALSCAPSRTVVRVLSPKKNFTAYTTHTTTVSVSLTDCDSVLTGATVLVTPSTKSVSFALKDDGIAPDTVADDGIYTGNWIPSVIGSTTLNIDASVGIDNLAGSVAGNVIEMPAYQYDDKASYNWIDATSGTKLTLNDDDSIMIPIGFQFSFYGIPFENVRVSSNGYLTFGSLGTAHLNEPIPSSNHPNHVIAPFWDDLTLGTSGFVCYLLDGVAPNRRLIVEWNNVSHYSNSGKVTFQVILHEKNKDILFQYKDVVFGSATYDNGASATVGIEEGSGTIGLQYSYKQAALSDQMAIRFAYPRLQIVITNNKPSFSIGDMINTTVTVHNGTSETIRGDIWVAVRLPHGGLLFYDAPNRFSSQQDPSVSCATMQPGPYVTDYPVITYTFPNGSEGTYTWYAIIVPCGANVMNADNWLASDVESFEVTREGDFYEDF